MTICQQIFHQVIDRSLLPPPYPRYHGYDNIYSASDIPAKKAMKRILVHLPFRMFL